MQTQIQMPNFQRHSRMLRASTKPKNWRLALVGSTAALAVIAVSSPAFAQSWAPTQCATAKKALANDANVMSAIQSNHPTPQQITAEKNTITADQAAVNYYCGPAAPGSTVGNITPRYMVLFVAYAPPGSTVSQGVSKVDYTSGSTAGTTETSEKSFKAGLKVTASVSGNAFGATAGVSVSDSQSVEDASKTSLEIKKTASVDVHVPGPATDGIDHDDDQIWIWTNPSVAMVSEGANFSSVLGTASGKSVSLQYLSVGQIKRFIASPTCQNLPTPADTSFCNQLKGVGFTTTDYTAMLSADPFANGAAPLDPNRFIQTSTTFPYEPGGDTVTFDTDNEATNTVTASTTTQNALSVTVTAGYDSPAVKATVAVEDSYTWTHEYSQANSLGTSQKATAVVGAPSTNWTGPQNVGVWYDCLWNTFYFQYLDPTGNPILLTGTLTDSAGKAQAHQLVTLIYPGRIMRTYTNSKGQYTFLGNAPGISGKVGAGAVALTTVNLMGPSQHLDLKTVGLVKLPPKIVPKPDPKR